MSEQPSESFDLAVDEQGRLLLKQPGEADVVDVRLRRAMPWSNPDRFVSIRNAEGKEVRMVEDLAALPPDLRRTIDQWLAGASFVPKITRVDDVDVRFGYQQWRVQTDRGPVEFRVQEREDIRFLPDGRFRVKDADGNVYELPAITALDEHSRRAVASLI